MSSLMVAQHNAAGTTGNHHSLPHFDILQRLGSLVTNSWLVDFWIRMQSGRPNYDIILKKWWNTIQPGYETNQPGLEKPAPKSYIYTIWLEMTWLVFSKIQHSPYTILHQGFIPNKGKPQNWKPGNLAFATHPDRLNVSIVGNFEVFFFLRWKCWLMSCRTKPRTLN